MTVSELIDELATLPPDRPVVLVGPFSEGISAYTINSITNGLDVVMVLCGEPTVL